jgi:hypothetical protein
VKILQPEKNAFSERRPEDLLHSSHTFHLFAFYFLAAVDVTHFSTTEQKNSLKILHRIITPSSCTVLCLCVHGESKEKENGANKQQSARSYKMEFCSRKNVKKTS